MLVANDDDHCVLDIGSCQVEMYSKPQQQQQQILQLIIVKVIIMIIIITKKKQITNSSHQTSHDQQQRQQHKYTNGITLISHKKYYDSVMKKNERIC